jgi:demethylmenaquinone methyltransferase/2-methoxy-6-polyprenyl-1,4-benzoquinol methylase
MYMATRISRACALVGTRHAAKIVFYLTLSRAIVLMKRTIAHHTLQTPSLKRLFNAHLFVKVAPRYDTATRALSFFRDQVWKRRIVRAIPRACDTSCTVLDCASGTGDLCLHMRQRFPHARIMGIDLSARMLQAASVACSRARSGCAVQDMGALGVRDNAVDVVTGGYALRNAPDLHAVLMEIHRVLKPGGYGVFLDFSRMSRRMAWRVEYALLVVWCRLWSLILHGTPHVYGYIPESLAAFPDRTELHRMLREHDFALVYAHRYFFGIMEAIIVRTPLSR